MKRKKIRILSLNIEALTKREAQARILKILTQSKKCARIYTPNPQMALGCARSRELTRLFAQADMLLPDGIGIIAASKILGTPLPERITGIDTAEFVLKCASKLGLSVAFLGAKPTVAKRAAKHLKRRYPKLSVVYAHHGYFDKKGSENKKIINEINAVSPDILFVCFGFPLQEKWIDENVYKLPSLRLCMGLGGALDVWSESTRRAPREVQALGLEWLWRTLGDKTRYKNFLELRDFLFLVFTQKSKKKH